jgi:hypothetical protein
MTNYTQITVEFWADLSSANPNWTRVFAFGNQNGDGTEDSGIDYCSFAPGNYQNLNEFSTNANSGTYANSTPGLNGTTNVHVTVVVDPVNANNYYYNGDLVVSTVHPNPAPPQPLDEIDDAYSLIGKSLDNLDPTLTGTIHEFRIYQGVLSQQQVALDDATGPDDIVSSPGSLISISFNSTASSLVAHQSESQTLSGNFSAVTNLNLIAYGGAVFTSGNTNIATINTNGIVTGAGAGTTTVVATYGGLSATNTITVLAVPTAMTHRYSFATDASDSIEGANGTLMGDASVTGGQLVLDGTTGTYVSLPGNIINIATNASVTFEAWTTIGAIAVWSHVFEFGAQGASNVYCAPRAQAAGFVEFGISEGFSGGQTPIWANGWSNITLHITDVIDPTTSSLSVYTNGVLMQAIYNATGAVSSIATNLATLGHSSYGDPDALLSIDEFRIYTGAFTPAQVAMTDQSGPNSTNFNPGALVFITVPATNYPAYSPLLPPIVLATYANLTNFNLLANTMATEPGLVVTSSDPTIISVNAQNMLSTYHPGTVTLTATYQGKASSATMRVGYEAVLAHRYSFTTDASDSVGGANGTNEGTANESGGQVQLDGGSGDYVALPGGLLGTYRSATMDIWATISSGQQAWSRLWEFADPFSNPTGTAVNELYLAPAWNPGGTAVFVSFDPPDGGFGLGPASPAIINQTVHLTCVVGDGAANLYSNVVLILSTTNFIAPVSQAGLAGSWIGYSPYGDPGIDGSVDEYRIYNGRLSQQEIEASDVLGPDVTLSTTNATLIASASGGNIVLSWPVADASFVIEAKANISPSTPWTTLTNAPILVGDQFELTVPNSGTNQFYRLIK